MSQWCSMEVDSFVRSKVTSKKLMVFLLASIAILRPLDLKMLLTSCFVFSISLGVALPAKKFLMTPALLTKKPLMKVATTTSSPIIHSQPKSATGIAKEKSYGIIHHGTPT